MNICVIGTGYVGLVAGTCLADSGNDVICVDVIEEKIAGLKRGELPIYEPGLQELVERNAEEGRLSFTTDLTAAVRASRIVFIAVGTPQDEDGAADMQYVLDAARAIGRAMERYTIIVLKSTVPVGTADRVRAVLREVTDVEFGVASNPEFLKEGAAIKDFMYPDRVVIGADDPRVAETMKGLYAPFVRTGNPLLVMDNRSAEMTKYAANAMLATRISFMNEIATLCEKANADVRHVRQGMGSDSRIGYPFLFPGLGYGGSCFPKDVRALIHTAEESGATMDILRAVDEVNERQKHRMVPRVAEHFGGDLTGKIIAIWGLAFKPQTDDMREAPACVIIEELLARGAKVQVHDPVAMPEAKRLFGDRIVYGRKPYDALEGASALILVTEWNEFRRPNMERMGALMAEKVIFDGRNILSPADLRENGFTYFGIGISGTEPGPA